jgi:four helix bundle protein
MITVDRKKAFRKRLYRYVVKLVRFMSQISANAEPTIKRQVIRSGTSIGANFFEAAAASSRKDYVNFFRHALKSANETRFWLALVNDTGTIPKTHKLELNDLRKETTEIANILAASIITMTKKDSGVTRIS